MTTSEGSVLDRGDTGGLDRRFSADAASVTAARHALRDWLIEGGPDAPGIDAARLDGQYPDVLLVASELASNAVRAGSTWFRLRAWRQGNALAVEVADDGPGFDAPLPSTEDVPPMDAENGRGLFLVRMMVDRCTIFTSDTGTIVRCRITLPDAAG